MHLKYHDFDQDGHNDSHDNEDDAVSDASKSRIAKAIEYIDVHCTGRTFNWSPLVQYQKER